jgi:DNA-binding PadR family transcriptional regulator
MKYHSKIVEKLRARTVKNFMDIFVLEQLKVEPLSGYDVIGLIHNKFKVLVSSGTIYSMLYSLERQGLIEGTEEKRKRVYNLTEKGQQTMDTLAKAKGEIQNCMKNLFTET